MDERVHRSALDDLSDQALQLGLISRYSFEGSQVVLESGSDVFRFPEPEALAFLSGMLTGAGGGRDTESVTVDGPLVSWRPTSSAEKADHPEFDFFSDRLGGQWLL